VPETYRSESLAAALGTLARGRRILLARADRGRAVLKQTLEQLADVDQVAVYHNRDAESLPEPVIGRIAEGTVDWITLTSSAITTRLHGLLPESARDRVGRDIRLASLSPVTSETAAALGWNIAVEAAEFTWEGLVTALVEKVAQERRS
jgi:uroporphyrinogen III methyltransferase/synthase